MQAGRYVCDVSHLFFSHVLTSAHIESRRLEACISIFTEWAIRQLVVELDEAEGEEGMMSPRL